MNKLVPAMPERKEKLRTEYEQSRKLAHNICPTTIIQVPKVYGLQYLNKANQQWLVERVLRKKGSAIVGVPPMDKNQPFQEPEFCQVKIEVSEFRKVI